MRFRAAIFLVSLCSGCNALTGVSELEPVACTTDCADASSSADSGADSGGLDTAIVDVGADTGSEDAAALCGNSTKDPLESDVDCGGPCPKCALDKGCSGDGDCASAHCVMNKCATCPAGMAVITTGKLGSHYCIDTHETTNAEYKAWLDTSPSTTSQSPVCSWNTSFVPTSLWPFLGSRASHPVRYVDWCDAQAYCAGQKKRLCGKIGGGAGGYSEYASALLNEWFRACSVAGARTYPYGSTLDIDFCNSKNSSYGTTVPVGSLVNCTNPYATFDMSGNVSEWDDSCSASMGPTDGCRSRGGSYGTLDPRCAVSEVWARQTTNEWIGIRCCDD